MSPETKQNISTARTSDTYVDQGLRKHMLNVYNYMTSGLALTGLIAWMTAQSQTMINLIYGTPLQWIVMLAPLGFVFFLSARIHKMSFQSAQITFWLFAALMGLWLASIFLVFTGVSIARVFFITAGTFAAMSIYGYTTKKDLTNFGAFLFMGLIGIIVASIVNIFIGSTALHFAISVIGVLVFVGLTAYDTQHIKRMYVESDETEIAGKKAIIGSLKLYLDFINLFIMLLHLFGNRR
jgi:hypothetical protein